MIPPAPRRPRLRAWLGTTHRAGLVASLVLAAGWGAAYGAELGTEAATRAILFVRGRSVPATVLSFEPTGRQIGRRGRSRPQYRTTLRFTTADGLIRHVQAITHETGFVEAARTGRLDVLVDPLDPTRMRPVPLLTFMSNASLVVLAIPPVLGLVIAGAVLRNALRRRALLATGDVVQGRVVRASPGGTVVMGKRARRVVFSYPMPGGRMEGAEDLFGPEADGPLEVVVDPRRPSRAVIATAADFS